MLYIGALTYLLNVYSFSINLTSRNFKELSSTNNVYYKMRVNRSLSYFTYNSFCRTRFLSVPLKFRLLSLPPTSVISV